MHSIIHGFFSLLFEFKLRYDFNTQVMYKKNRIEKKKTKKETEIDHASINNCSDDSSDVQNRYSSNEKEFILFDDFQIINFSQFD